ncbi:hypothetical protein E8E14_012281 [Neopestalotiopsis sp. 37M]|nr:hypothetical protein E8E14_012281 [Neopestalotiopsis sp. 37M]
MPLPTFKSFTKTWHSEPYPFISPSRPELSAEGKNVVITGGGTGIGKAIGIAFAQAGAQSVAVLGRRRDRLEAAAQAIQAANSSTQVLFETGDVDNLESLVAALDKIVARVGKTDIFLANAGILPTEGPVAQYDEAELRRCLETNVIGAFNSVQAFVRCAAPGAKLFNTSSGLGHLAPLPEIPGVFSYSASKAAALKIFEYFATENPGYHVVSIQPGIISTEINPMELPAHMLVWLASKEAEFLKDKYVWVNWDAEELLARADEIRSSMLLRVSLNGMPM